jgi:hypothetical protein
MNDMSDLVVLMDAMGFSGAHKIVLKTSITTWKKNPDVAMQTLAAVKVPRASVVKSRALLNVELVCGRWLW